MKGGLKPATKRKGAFTPTPVSHSLYSVSLANKLTELVAAETSEFYSSVQVFLTLLLRHPHLSNLSKK